MESSVLVGLAGHTDHGKTSLIKALNGFDGDGSRQESIRGITIDISFSNLILQTQGNKRNIALIDVPGHHELVKNMIAGIFSVDVLLWVIACDEGIMPQSREHLQIAHALGVKQIFCVFTKHDKIPPSREQILKKQVKQYLDDFFGLILVGMEWVCIYDEDSLNRLKQSLSTLKCIPKADQGSGIFRCYVDRSFSLKGIGSVISGSVISGSVELEDRLWVCDLARTITLRGMHSHNLPITKACSSMRVAFHVGGVVHTEIKRGSLISKKGYLRGFDRIDVVLRPLDCAQLHLKEAQFFMGTVCSRVKIFVLSNMKLDFSIESLGYKKGEELVFATLKLERKVFCIFKERFLLRHDGRNLCSGGVLNPISDPMKKSSKIILLTHLLKEDFLSAFEFLCRVHKRGFGLISSPQRFALTHQRALDFANKLSECIVDEKNLVIYHAESLEFIKEEVMKIFLRNSRALLSAKSLVSRFHWASIDFLNLALGSLVSENRILCFGSIYMSENALDSCINTWDMHSIEDFVSNKIVEVLSQTGITPPAPHNIYDSLDIDRDLGDRVLKRLCVVRKVKRLEHNVFILSSHLSSLVEKLRGLIKQYGYINIAILKQELSLSRKFCTAYLSYLDRFEDVIKNQNQDRYFKV